MSRHCTSGRPASIIVANWRVNTTSSRVPTPFLNRLKPLPLRAAFGLTETGMIDCARSCIIAAASVAASTTPFFNCP